MSVWFCIPSAKPVHEANAVLDRWRAMGFKIAVFRDFHTGEVNADLIVYGQYHGWPKTVNGLFRMVLAIDPDAQWVVTGGDDMEPQYGGLNADDIATHCTEHFGGTFGIMQPTGDRWGIDDTGFAASERICGSPFIGRDAVRRLYRCNGPFNGQWEHMWADEELFNVANSLGILWQRPDLTHLHHHWTKVSGVMPDYMKEHYKELQTGRRTFFQRKSEKFPGHEPLPE